MSLTFEYISDEQKEQIQEFDCCDEISVENFLKNEALELHKLKTAITRLYYDNEDNLVGYFTLHNDLVELYKNQKVRYKNEYSWSLPKYNYLPAVKLHYFGIDTRHRGRGYGEFLLGEIIQTVQNISRDTGCNFITVEALPNSVRFYEKYGFIRRKIDTEFINM